MSSKDPNYIRMINSSKWRKLRHYQLEKHPLCEMCLTYNIATPASVVHHIEPVEDVHNYVEQHKRMFNTNNLMSLCSQCHSRIHEGYHTADAVAKRNDQRTERSSMMLKGYTEEELKPKRIKQPTLPTWKASKA